MSQLGFSWYDLRDGELCHKRMNFSHDIFLFDFLATVSHEPLLDHVLELIMNEKPPNSTSLFLSEDSEKPLPSEEGLHHLCRVLQKQMSGSRRKMGGITRDSVKTFLRRNTFVIFTVAAVALGKGVNQLAKQQEKHIILGLFFVDSGTDVSHLFDCI